MKGSIVPCLAAVLPVRRRYRVYCTPDIRQHLRQGIALCQIADSMARQSTSAEYHLAGSASTDQRQYGFSGDKAVSHYHYYRLKRLSTPFSWTISKPSQLELASSAAAGY